MFFLGRLSNWWRRRKRLLYRYDNGTGYVWADPIAVGRLLEKHEPDFFGLIKTSQQNPEELPPGPLRAGAKTQRDEATERLIVLSCRVFGLTRPTGAVIGPGQVGDSEALGVLIGYFAYMEDLADAADFTSRPPGSDVSSPPASTTASSAESGGAANVSLTVSPSDGSAPLPSS